MEQHDLLPDLTIDGNTNYHIRGIATWGKFLGIMGFIFCGLMVIVAIFAGGVIANTMGRYEGSYASGIGAVITIVYLILAGVFFIPTLFLFQASTKLRTALDMQDQGLINEGFGKLRQYFKFWGIMTIIFLSLWVLSLLFQLMSMSR